MFDRGHRAAVVIGARRTGTQTELMPSWLELPSWELLPLQLSFWGSHLWGSLALWKGRARGRKGTAPSGSASGTESGEPGLIAPVGGVAGGTDIHGRRHPSSRQKLRHCCLVRLCHIKSSRMEAVSTYTFLRKTHIVGPYRKRFPFIYSSTFTTEHQLLGFNLLPLNHPVLRSLYARHQIYHFSGFIFGNTTRGEERWRVVKY